MQRRLTAGTPQARFPLLAALLAASLLLGCEGRQQAPGQRPTPEVSALTVAAEGIMQSVELPGRTSAFLMAEIRPQLNGLIQKRLFTEGSDVKAGQALYQIDPAPFQAALDNASAALRRAEASLPAVRSRAERYRALVEDKAVSQQDHDDAAAALIQAEADIQYWKANVETARINLGYAKVVAPISGRIGKSSVTDGAIVTAYQPRALATIQQMDPIYVDVPQSTSELLRLKRSLGAGRLNQKARNQNKVKLILEDGTPYALEGVLQFRDVSVDPTTGSVILRMVFPNPDGVLLPEMFVRALVNEGVNEQAILVPQQAVFRNPKGEPQTLIVDADGKVGLRLLTLDRAVGSRWLVAAGLAPGDRVIMEGGQMLRPGALVKVVPFVQSPPAQTAPPAPQAK